MVTLNNNGSKILSFIARETFGQSYRSYRYCFEREPVPTLDYEDKKDIEFKKRGETDTNIKKAKSVKKLSEYLQRHDKPLFQYFLDGSRRTYKIDDIVYDKRIYPVIAGQIGVGCCERRNPDNFKPIKYLRNLVLSIPKCANHTETNDLLFFNNLLIKLNENNTILLSRNMRIDKILPYTTKLNEGEKYEHKGISSVHDEMLELEKRMVKELAVNNRLNDNAFLIKDGSLEYQTLARSDSSEFKQLSAYKSNYACVVGVSKMFNPESLARNVKDISRRIAELKPYERTPAFMYQTPHVGETKFSVWYLRLRDSLSPFDGVVKVEKVLVSDKQEEEGLDSDEVDRISANIMNERYPVCYGNDERWSKHLYPIYLTERYIKSQSLSDIYFTNLFS